MVYKRTLEASPEAAKVFSINFSAAVSAVQNFF